MKAGNTGSTIRTNTTFPGPANGNSGNSSSATGGGPSDRFSSSNQTTVANATGTLPTPEESLRKKLIELLQDITSTRNDIVANKNLGQLLDEVSKVRSNSDHHTVVRIDGLLLSACAKFNKGSYIAELIRKILSDPGSSGSIQRRYSDDSDESDDETDSDYDEFFETSPTPEYSENGGSSGKLKQDLVNALLAFDNQRDFSGYSLSMILDQICGELLDPTRTHQDISKIQRIVVAQKDNYETDEFFSLFGEIIQTCRILQEEDQSGGPTGDTGQGQASSTSGPANNQITGGLKKRDKGKEKVDEYANTDGIPGKAAVGPVRKPKGEGKIGDDDIGSVNDWIADNNLDPDAYGLDEAQAWACVAKALEDVGDTPLTFSALTSLMSLNVPLDVFKSIDKRLTGSVPSLAQGLANRRVAIEKLIAFLEERQLPAAKVEGEENGDEENVLRTLPFLDQLRDIANYRDFAVPSAYESSSESSSGASGANKIAVRHLALAAPTGKPQGEDVFADTEILCAAVQIYAWLGQHAPEELQTLRSGDSLPKSLLNLFNIRESGAHRGKDFYPKGRSLLALESQLLRLRDALKTTGLRLKPGEAGRLEALINHVQRRIDRDGRYHDGLALARGGCVDKTKKLVAEPAGAALAGGLSSLFVFGSMSTGVAGMLYALGVQTVGPGQVSTADQMISTLPPALLAAMLHTPVARFTTSFVNDMLGVDFFRPTGKAGTFATTFLEIMTTDLPIILGFGLSYGSLNSITDLFLGPARWTWQDLIRKLSSSFLGGSMGGAIAYLTKRVLADSGHCFEALERRLNLTGFGAAAKLALGSVIGDKEPGYALKHDYLSKILSHVPAVVAAQFLGPALGALGLPPFLVSAIPMVVILLIWFTSVHVTAKSPVPRDNLGADTAKKIRETLASHGFFPRPPGEDAPGSVPETSSYIRFDWYDDRREAQERYEELVSGNQGNRHNISDSGQKLDMPGKTDSDDDSESDIELQELGAQLRNSLEARRGEADPNAPPAEGSSTGGARENDIDVLIGEFARLNREILRVDEDNRKLFNAIAKQDQRAVRTIPNAGEIVVNPIFQEFLRRSGLEPDVCISFVNNALDDARGD